MEDVVGQNSKIGVDFNYKLISSEKKGYQTKT